jgi:hypothetical protein
MYAGAIWQDSGGLTGCMQDAFGKSELSEIVISDTEVRFVKTYEGRQRPIRYLFRKKDGNTWVGDYRGEGVGVGVSRCLVTEVDDECFVSESITKLLGRKKAHVWPKHPPASA